MRLTDISFSRQNLAYVLSSSVVSFLMQVITFAVMNIYFSAVNKINISIESCLLALIFMALGALGATLLNEIIVLFIHSSTTFSRLSAVVGAIAGFAVATYLPYGTLSSTAQTLVKLVPSSYEASALRSLFLNELSKSQMPASVRSQMINYLGIHFKINDYQLTRWDTAYVMVGMIAILIVIITFSSLAAGREKCKLKVKFQEDSSLKSGELQIEVKALQEDSTVKKLISYLNKFGKRDRNLLPIKTSDRIVTIKREELIKLKYNQLL